MEIRTARGSRRVSGERRRIRRGCCLWCVRAVPEGAVEESQVASYILPRNRPHFRLRRGHAGTEAPIKGKRPAESVSLQAVLNFVDDDIHGQVCTLCGFCEANADKATEAFLIWY